MRGSFPVCSPTRRPARADSCPPDGAPAAPGAGGGAAVYIQATLRFPDTVSAAGLAPGDFELRVDDDPEPSGPPPAASQGEEGAACPCGEDPDAAPARPPLSGARAPACAAASAGPAPRMPAPSPEDAGPPG